MTDKASTLKPCPFCGEAAEIEYGGPFCWPRCSNLGGCGAVFSLKSYDNVPAAIASWNRRASPASPAIVEADDELLGKCKDFIINQARREWIEGSYCSTERVAAVNALKDLDALTRAAALKSNREQREGKP